MDINESAEVFWTYTLKAVDLYNKQRSPKAKSEGGAKAGSVQISEWELSHELDEKKENLTVRYKKNGKLEYISSYHFSNEIKDGGIQPLWHKVKGKKEKSCQAKPLAERCFNGLLAELSAKK